MKRGSNTLPTWRLWPTGLAALLLVMLVQSTGQAAGPSVVPFRIGFTRQMFTEVNESDARAAIKVWGQTVAKDRGIAAAPEPLLFNDEEEMLNALQNKAVDVVAVSTLEYELLQRKTTFGPLFFTVHDNELSEEYLLLAHRDGPVQSLADLAGRDIQFHDNLRLCLAPLWLDSLLIENGQKPSESLAGRITKKANLSKVLLPVFFRQVDACVVSRSGFDTITELNPQLGRHLVVIASSSAVVPAVFAFRSDYAPPYKEALLDGIRNLHGTAAGRQVLMVFNGNKIEEHPKSFLSSALQLIASHSQMMKDNSRP